MTATEPGLISMLPPQCGGELGPSVNRVLVCGYIGL